MKKILFVGLFFYCSSASAQFGTPNSIIWPGMSYGNPAMWSSQLTHTSQRSTGSKRYDPSIERAKIDNDYHKAETYWKKRELWEKHNSPKPRTKYVRKPFDPDEIYAGDTVFWPVVFRDKKFNKYKSKIEKILGFTGEREWNDIRDFLNNISCMESMLASDMDKYPASYYGEAKTFLKDLKKVVNI